MPVYSLIEYKLRQYLYLGHEYCIYVPPSIRNSFWNQNHHDDVTGVKIIGRIVKNNKTEEINSIVPILIKIKKEDKLFDDRLLIFALAVCARFNLESCVKMVADAYSAVSTICTDGLKILMFVKFCETAAIILFDQGYTTIMCNGHGRGFAKSLTNWYLSRDPLLTTKDIVRNKSYDGWSHKDVMKLIHLHSDEPCHIMYIVYTLSGIEKVEKLFGSKMKDVCIEDSDETFENMKLKCIYNFINQVESIKKMDECALQDEIELNRWDHIHEVIPREMLKSSSILTSLVVYLPLKKVLENTFFFAKNKLFCDSTSALGLKEYIFRFNNTSLLKKSKIHPIESFIQYAKYARTSINILNLQYNILKKEAENSVIRSIDGKLKTIVKSQKTPDTEEVVIPPTVENDGELFNKETLTQNQNDQICNSASSSSKNTSHENSAQNLKKSKHGQKSLAETTLEKNQRKQQVGLADSIHHFLTLNINSQQINPVSTTKEIVPDINQSKVNDVNQNQSSVMNLMKPLPKLEVKLITFLSEYLIKKTCQVLDPLGLRMMITFDSRMCMKKSMCKCLKLISVHEAITLITLSLIYPENLENKPIVYGLKSNTKSSKEIEIDYNQPLTFSSLESILFERSSNDGLDLLYSIKKKGNHVPQVYPHISFKWAKENNKEFDVFVFLGTNKMNFKYFTQNMKEYKAHFKIPVKIVLLCLNGKHYEQITLGRGSTLFIIGFDKDVGKIINSFIKDEF